MTRHQDVNDARAVADEWASAHNLPPSGGYSGDWYVDSYLAGWWPDGWVKWWAAYNGDPGSLLGGEVVGHQYTSTPIDQSVFEDSEMMSSGGGEVTDPERAAMQDQIDGLVNSLGYISYDLLKPVAAQKSGTKAVQRLVAGIRDQAEQHGISHA